METITHEVPLTSGEVAALWGQYMNDSMASCVLTYALSKVQDKDMASIFAHALDLSKFHMESVKRYLKKEQFPIPQGFTDEDVNLEAPSMFTDAFMLFYLYTMTLHGLNGYSLSVGSSVREDQRSYFIDCLTETAQLYDRILDVMLNKGLFSRSPFAHPAEKIDIVRKESFFAGWFGERRPLTAIEVTNIYYNMQKLQAKVVLELAFSHVAKTKVLKEYFHKGAKLCSDQWVELEKILNKDDLHAPRSWTDEVIPSSEAPFSEKLMMFHVVSLLAVTVGYYGAALSTCQRRDLVAQYAKLMLDIGNYAQDGLELMMERGWVEQPPMINSRKIASNLT